MRNAVGTRADSRKVPQLFATRKRKQLVHFDFQNVRSFRSCQHNVNSCVSIELKKHDFKPISARIFFELKMSLKSDHCKQD